MTGYDIPADPYECPGCRLRGKALILCPEHKGRLGIASATSPRVIDTLRARIEAGPDRCIDHVPQPALSQPHPPVQRFGPVPPPPSRQPEPADAPDLLDTLRL